MTAKCREDCEDAFRSLGQYKLRAMEQGLVHFQGAFARIQNVDLHVGVVVEGAPAIDEVRVTEAGRLTLSLMDAIGGVAAAGAAGAAASSAAVAGVAAVGT